MVSSLYLQNAIHNHIRLFEPLVIKALKQYTTSTSVALQRQVLDLLAQLVQLRVNYCLLDSDQVKQNFTYKLSHELTFIFWSLALSKNILCFRCSLDLS